MAKKSSKNKQSKILGVISILLVLILYILIASILWGSKNFGNVSMEEIIFTLRMPLSGSGSDFVSDYILKVLIPGIVFFIIFTVLIIKPKNYTYKICILHKIITLYPFKINGLVLIISIIIGLVGSVKLADKNFKIIEYAKNQITSSTFIEDNYVFPEDVKLTFPSEKRNLIYILLESGETSIQDRENGGFFDQNPISEMTQIAKDNVSFSQNEKIAGGGTPSGCTWTMAGMVSQFSGIPLNLGGKIDCNNMDQYENFLPGVTSLGDILEKEGYNNYFMIGSDAKFSGRDKFMHQHGNYEIWDYYTAVSKGKIPIDYFRWWGYEDQKLYEYAKEELTRISQNEEPFNFTMLTVDTHHMGGYVCPLCRNDFSEQYENVWACASRQLNDFLNWIKEQPFYENTTIVISGDHCSMDSDYYNDEENSYATPNKEDSRKVYNAIVNSPIEPINEKNRRFITLDMFPTTLAALGVDIEGERLGLGTNLFSEKETLSEEYGYDLLYEEFQQKSYFYFNTFLYK